MKKLTALILAAAALTLSGCTSADTSLTALGAAEPDRTETALETSPITAESDPAAADQPPLMQIEASYSEVCSASILTCGAYSWENGGEIITADSLTPVSMAENGFVTAVIDTAGLAKNPRILLNGGEITSVTCYKDDFTSKNCGFNKDEIILCDDWSYNVYCVNIAFPQGSCDYIFTTRNSSAEKQSPPMLKVCVNGMYYALSSGNFDRSFTEGEETMNTIACGESPYQSYANGSCVMTDLGGAEKVGVILPEGAEISSVYCFTSDNDCTELATEGGSIILPKQPTGKGYCLNIAFPQGSCEYVFGDNSPLRMLMVNDILYVDTLQKATEPRCGVSDGQITSVVPEGAVPTENNQSNFGEYNYQYWDGGYIDVDFGEYWERFAPAEICNLPEAALDP